MLLGGISGAAVGPVRKLGQSLIMYWCVEGLWRSTTPFSAVSLPVMVGYEEVEAGVGLDRPLNGQAV